MLEKVIKIIWENPWAKRELHPGAGCDRRPNKRPPVQRDGEISDVLVNV